MILDELREMLEGRYSKRETEIFIERLREVMSKEYEHIDETVREYESTNFRLDISKRTADTLIAIFKPPPPPADPFDSVYLKVRVGGNTFYFKPGDRINMANFTVPDDHEDVPFSVAPVTGAKDQEGADIPADGITTTPAASDNDAAVSIVDDGAGGQALHFGAPGVAHVAVDSSYQGNVVKHSEATILVTTGTLDPASITGGDLTIPGLTPDA